MYKEPLGFHTALNERMQTVFFLLLPLYEVKDSGYP